MPTSGSTPPLSSCATRTSAATTATHWASTCRSTTCRACAGRSAGRASSLRPPRRRSPPAGVSARTTERPLGSARALRLELRLVVADEGADVVGQVEQLEPLLLVERHREAPEPVDREPALLAHLEGHPATRSPLEPLVLRPQALDLRLGVVLGHRSAIAHRSVGFILARRGVPAGGLATGRSGRPLRCRPAPSCWPGSPRRPDRARCRARRPRR